jgi:LysM repeat protein
MRKVLTLLLLLAAPAAAVTEHKVSQTEHLWGLAGRYYGDPYRWKAIAEANPQVKDPHWIYPGQVILIPDLPPVAPVEAAAPVEASLPLQAPVPVEASTPMAVEPELQAAVAPAPAPALAPIPVREPAPPPSLDQDSLSVELPEALSGQYPSMTRFKAPRKWTQDGEVAEYEGREALAAEGDFISGHFKKTSVAVGEKLYVLRDEAPEDSDEDKTARYLVRVGVVSVQKDLGKGVYRLLILRSGDSVQVGDFLSKERL